MSEQTERSKAMRIEEENISFVVGDGNGTFLSKIEGELTTSIYNNAKVYATIGEAMAECAKYNKSSYPMRVFSFINIKKH